jgi:hypothetical protein
LPIFDRMPNISIIGAAKACTSALYNYLVQNSQVFVSRVKEPMFFSRGAFCARGSRLVRRQVFWGSENYPVRAEAKPYYLYWSEKVAPRIKEAFGERSVTFIVSFRETVSRAYSWYWNMAREVRI